MVNCSFFGEETHYIPKVFKKSNLRVAYKTKCSVKKVLNPKTLLSDENKLHGSGIYWLNCIDCTKKYSGQTGNKFEIGYKESLYSLVIKLRIQTSLNIFERTAMLLEKRMI